MDSNAQFSEIFDRQCFTNINAQEKGIFTTQYSFETNYSRCNKLLAVDSDVLVNYVTLSDLQRCRYSEMFWPVYVSLNHSKLCKSLYCDLCDIQNGDGIILKAFLPAKILFVEFASDAIGNLRFFKNIISGKMHALKGIVRCCNRHFTK